MEIGAFFILVIVAAVIAVLGAIVYVIAAKRRRQELGQDAAEPSGERPRPRHRAVETEQNTEFVGTR
jgi:heme/copper-type cytochrome/quinol oxidase subunit 2